MDRTRCSSAGDVRRGKESAVDNTDALPLVRSLDKHVDGSLIALIGAWRGASASLASPKEWIASLSLEARRPRLITPLHRHDARIIVLDSNRCSFSVP